MSVTLLNAPSVVSFSGEFINVEFQCADYFQQVGVKAVNTLSLSDNIAAGVTKTIKYGNKTIVMVSSAVPDDSGLQFLAGSGTAPAGSLVVDYFRANPQLSSDFDIDFSGFNIIFTAKEKSIGYNFTSGGTNTVAGVPEIVKPNYSILFKLYLENADHSGFDQIFTTNLQLRFGEEGKAIAQINDKIQQKISVDMRSNGLEIPTTTVLECKTTSRKYYFEFAESYGETIAVRKLNKSSLYNVIQGGLSYQAQSSKTVLGLISPGGATSDRFLRQGIGRQFMREDQPQYLYFFNTRTAKANAKLKVYHYFEDGTNGEFYYAAFNMEQYKKYAFNLSYGSAYSGIKMLVRYDVWLVDSTDTRISEKQSFYVDRKPQNFIRFFLSWNSWGSLESRYIKGKGQNSFEIESKSAVSFLKKGYRTQDGAVKVFGKSGTNGFSVNTGFMDRASLLQYQEFFLSKLIFRYLSGTILPIEITTTKIEDPEDGTFLYAYAFEYRYTFSENAYTETDKMDLPLFGESPFIPKPIAPVIIYTGTPSHPSTDIITQQIP